MASFKGVPDANRYIVALITQQADQQGEPLSKVERDMLYFSESGWTPAGIEETVADFERECDGAVYEKRIADLITSILKDIKKGRKKELATWLEAVRILSKEDRYLLVLIDEAGVKVRTPADLWKSWGAGLAICAIATAIGLLLPNPAIFESRESAAFWVWVAACGFAAVCTVFHVLDVKTNARDVIERFLSRLAGAIQKHRHR